MTIEPGDRFTRNPDLVTREIASETLLVPVTGKLADLAVLDRDLMTIPADDIRNVEVEMTVVGGAVMYARE